ncbi:MAG: hypothetical protein AUF76_11750 [Acidobacteria bacterium 13_1_20CM_2_65_9]|nr:MAG: hypothetical protein AUF76_11750 [Acidobacteria bacterium 13_1_20CM_2_65_9]
MLWPATIKTFWRAPRNACRRTLGGIGYALDYWLGTSPWFLLGGLLLGVAVGMWELAKTVFRR